MTNKDIENFLENTLNEEQVFFCHTTENFVVGTMLQIGARLCEGSMIFGTSTLEYLGPL